MDALPCGQDARDLCLRDTAIARIEPNMPYPVARAEWVWFGVAGDSIEWSVAADHAPHDGLAHLTSMLGQDRDTTGNTASTLRRRLSRTGIVALDATLEPPLGDTVPYRLVIRRVRTSPASHPPSGGVATLTVTGRRSTDRFALVPLSLVGRQASLDPWRLFVDTYKVILLRDSLYQICYASCDRVDTVRLRPNTRTIKAYR